MSVLPTYTILSPNLFLKQWLTAVLSRVGFIDRGGNRRLNVNVFFRTCLFIEHS